MNSEYYNLTSLYIIMMCLIPAFTMIQALRLFFPSKKVLLVLSVTLFVWLFTAIQFTVTDFFSTSQIGFLTPSMADETKKLPLWQVGIALGGISVPHYAGSNQRYNLPFVFPSFIYRGDRLRATREGVRGIFFSSKHLAVDAGLAIGLPVDSRRNDARKGMPDIPLTLEIGPRLVTRLYGSGSGGIDIFARIPWRIAGGIDGTSAGWILAPDILITNIKNLPWGLSAFASLGLKYGSVEYNKLFYGVEDRDSTSLRPAYPASQGISWYSFVFNVGRKFSSKFSTRLYLQWRTLSGSEVADSPLVKNQNDYTVGLWFTWLPWKSKAMESDIDRLPEPEGDL